VRGRSGPGPSEDQVDSELPRRRRGKEVGREEKQVPGGGLSRESAKRRG